VWRALSVPIPPRQSGRHVSLPCTSNQSPILASLCSCTSPSLCMSDTDALPPLSCIPTARPGYRCTGSASPPGVLVSRGIHTFRHPLCFSSAGRPSRLFLLPSQAPRGIFSEPAASQPLDRKPLHRSQAVALIANLCIDHHAM
jgi:hypothetical protein